MLELFLWFMAALATTVSFMVVCGKSKGSIYSNGMFALACLGSACWIICLTLYMGADSEYTAGIFLKAAYISALIMPLGFWLYGWSLVGQKHKYLLRIVMSSIGIVAVGVLSSMILQDGSRVYESINILATGNTFQANAGLFILAYLGIFFVLFLIYNAIIILRSKDAKKKHDIETSKGYRNIFGCIMVGSLPVVVFNGVLPIVGVSELVWIGPVSVAIAMIVVYYTSLRYKMFVSYSKILQHVANFVLVLLAAFLYCVIFYIVFLIIFRGAEPALPIILLNFLMAIILILLLPTINYSRNYISSLIGQKGDDAK